ncbi:hypothetical protein [Aureivirga marina]|uniref:hypothetical protein n=1 Tax=Aureivirga marina TaxID=1182451 RepID=UPI0018CAC376|nr:hypothetical protein [Aureivirga marina]
MRGKLFDKFAIIINGSIGAWALLIFIFSFACTYYVFQDSDFLILKLNDENSKTIEGKIDYINPFDTSFFHDEIFAFEYSFELNNQKYFWVSFSEINSFKKNQKVKVEYLISDPSINRIKGFTNSPITKKEIKILFWFQLLTTVFLGINIVLGYKKYNKLKHNK